MTELAPAGPLDGLATRSPAGSGRPRVGSVDVLRGVSLLGILVMNIQSFAMPNAAYLNPSVFGSLEGLDGVAWSVGRLLFDAKFISLFSLLFGASLVLGGRETRPRRRLGWLLVFGLLHAYLVWYGDVLFTYGLAGLAVLGARGWSTRRQALVGLALLLVSPTLTALTGACFDSLPHPVQAALLSHLDASTVAWEEAVFRGGWWGQLPLRAAIAFDIQTLGLLLETGWWVAGWMLLGMAAVRRGVFEPGLPAWPWIPVAFSWGLPFTAAGLWLQWSTGFGVHTCFFAQALHELGAVGLAAGLGLSILALARRFAASGVTQAVGRLGRVAFTAYLMQSLVGTWVFGGQGLGLFGSVDRATLFLVPFAAWPAQVALAWWWTARFRVGPLEAVWRGLSRGDFSLRARRPTG